MLLFLVVHLWRTLSSECFILFTAHRSLFPSIITSVQRSKHRYSEGNHKPFTINPVQLSAKRNVSSDRYHVCTIHPTRRCFCLVQGRWPFVQQGNRPYSMKILLVFFIISRQILWFSTSNFAMFRMFYSLLWVIPGHLNFMCRRFETLCSNFIGGVSCLQHLWRWNRRCFPKRRHIKFGRRVITQ